MGKTFKKRESFQFFQKPATLRSHELIEWSCVVSGVNFLCTFVPTLRIETAGRRLLLLLSVIGMDIFM